MADYSLENILFLDIETVPQTAGLEQMSEPMQELWKEKFEQFKQRQPDRYDDTQDAAYGYSNGAGLFAEFGRIVCISVGIIHNVADVRHLRVKSFANKDERVLLQDFAALLTKSFSGYNNAICGHNIKEFDMPYICRRMLINGIALPPILNIASKKPWEIPFIDTMDMWKFGDYKHYTSLKLLTAIFGIDTPKDDIDGSEVAHVYYQEDNLERIATYCGKDVIATTQLYLKFNGYPLLNKEAIEYVGS